MTRKKQNKNTKQFVSGTTLMETNTNKAIRHKPSYKKLELKMNRITFSYRSEIIQDMQLAGVVYIVIKRWVSFSWFQAMTLSTLCILVLKMNHMRCSCYNDRRTLLFNILMAMDIRSPKMYFVVLHIY